MKVVIDTSHGDICVCGYNKGQAHTHGTLSGKYVAQFIVYYNPHDRAFVFTKNRYDLRIDGLVKLLLDVNVKRNGELIEDENASWFFLKFQGQPDQIVDIDDSAILADQIGRQTQTLNV